MNVSINDIKEMAIQHDIVLSDEQIQNVLRDYNIRIIFHTIKKIYLTDIDSPGPLAYFLIVIDFNTFMSLLTLFTSYATHSKVIILTTININPTASIILNPLLLIYPIT